MAHGHGGGPNLAPLSRAKKILRTDAQYRVPTGNIAAIDFGTSSVSLAYTTKGNEEIVTMVLDHRSQAKRVPSAALFKTIDSEQIKMVAFGGAAQSHFISMKVVDHLGHIYFERIKMLMRREHSVNRESLVEAFSGEKYYLVEVIAFILQYLKDLLIDRLSRTAEPLKTTDFDWVITVPAIWDARGKRMMREAAYMAGLLTESGGIKKFTSISDDPLPLPDETNADRLSLALEPEVAALNSHEVVCQQIKGAGIQAALARPTNYMVIDIGGGTVDITAHTERDGDIIVENIPTGNDCGGTKVNEAFSKLLQKLVGDPKFRRFLASSTISEKHTQNTATLNKILYKDFEEQKLLFGQCQAADTITITLPSKFTKFYDDELIKRAQNMCGVEYEDDSGNLSLDKNVVESQLFGPALDGIISCTQDAIKQNEFKADTFYLVGGFGGSKHVHQKVSAAIEKLYQTKGLSCHRIIPTSPELAVARGAVMWRKNPEKVKARRADATYGIACSLPFNPAKHDEYYKYFDEEDSKDRCKNVLEVFLERGEVINTDEVITTSRIPSSQAATKSITKILTTPNIGVQYIENKSGQSTVTKIGELVVDIPNPDNIPNNERKVDITMDFSGTEIQAKAKYRLTGKEVKTVCNFLS